jgi:hypothetical protein
MELTEIDGLAAESALVSLVLESEFFVSRNSLKG